MLLQSARRCSCVGYHKRSAPHMFQMHTPEVTYERSMCRGIREVQDNAMIRSLGISASLWAIVS